MTVEELPAARLRTPGLSSRYVCAFRGRRDGYQVPVALQEAGRLEMFLTDAYATPLVQHLARLLPQRLAETINSRRDSRLPDNRVRCLWAMTLREHARHLLGRSHEETYARFDRRYAVTAAAIAEERRAGLFLYSPYAWEAFSARYSHAPRKFLFQYHPHWEAETRLLADDRQRFPIASVGNKAPWGIDEVGNEARARSDDSWRLADHVVCASQFTKMTLIAAGADARRISVIPYGIDLPERWNEDRPEGIFHALFVGSGIQRKGLHHLVMAWQRARLPRRSRLTVVCRVCDPAFVPMIATTPDVRLIEGASRAELDQLYDEATLFVMPSLIEGFGQVYLEALSHGLPILATPNTGAPDLGEETDGVYCVKAGDLDALSTALERLAQSLPGNREVNRRARRCAGRFSWEQFRNTIGALLQEYD